MRRLLHILTRAYNAARLGKNWFSQLKIFFIIFLRPITNRLALFQGPCVFDVKVNQKNFQIQLDGSHEEFLIFNEILVNQDYAVDLVPSSVKIIFDIGANVGFSAIYFALKFPNALVYAFEPNPLILERLKLNCAYFQNIRVYPYALTDTDGTVDFFVDTNKSIASSMIERHQTMKKFVVPTRSLDSLASEHDIAMIDILKFDIEGAEFLMFQSSSVAVKARAIIGEVHEDLTNFKVSDLTDRLRSHQIQVVHGRKVGRFILKAQL